MSLVRAHIIHVRAQVEHKMPRVSHVSSAEERPTGGSDSVGMALQDTILPAAAAAAAGGMVVVEERLRRITALDILLAEAGGRAIQTQHMSMG